MMMANVRPRCSSPISSRMNGNFCTVVMMIFLPCSRNVRSCPEPWRHRADDGGDLGELLDVVADLLVEDPPVGDHDDRVEDRLAVLLQPDQLVGQPGDRVALARPAECWIR